MEQWKRVDRVSWIIKISNYGRLMRGDRLYTPQSSSTGYLHVISTVDGASFKVIIHREVGLHFVDNPFDFPQINHIDSNKHNNHYTNLEWVTCAINNEKRIRKTYNWRTLNKTECTQILNWYHGGISIREMSLRLNIYMDQISRFLNGHTYKKYELIGNKKPEKNSELVGSIGSHLVAN